MPRGSSERGMVKYEWGAKALTDKQRWEQEIKNAAQSYRKLPAWMQRLEEKGRQSAVKPSSQETKQRETPGPTMEALAGLASNQSE